MTDRFAQFPRSLAEKARTVRLAGNIPALLAHPNWERPAPTVLWLHGRTVHKELDPGRYLRWIRAGLAACAIDLPGHGERADPELQSPTRTLDLLSRTIGEIDRVVEALADPMFLGVFDLDRLAIGGMSAGGMAVLRRLCDEHPFRCATVEATTGWLAALYRPELLGPEHAREHHWSVSHDPERVRPLDPMEHLASFRPIPLLALHSEADRIVPVEGQRRFITALRARYAAGGADADLVSFVTWANTGAPEEHSGFGLVTNDAKTRQVDFLSRHLGAARPA